MLGTYYLSRIKLVLIFWIKTGTKTEPVLIEYVDIKFVPSVHCM